MPNTCQSLKLVSDVLVQVSTVEDLSTGERVERQHGDEDDEGERIDEVQTLVVHTLDAAAELVRTKSLAICRTFDRHGGLYK